MLVKIKQTNEIGEITDSFRLNDSLTELNETQNYFKSTYMYFVRLNNGGRSVVTSTDIEFFTQL